MKHINTIETRDLCESAKKGGCGECQTSCQVLETMMPPFRAAFLA